MTIQMSSELNHLFAALSKLQGKIEKAKKDQSGYKNNYKFADLSQYIDLSQDLLAEYGLTVVQMPGEMEIIEITKEFEKIKIKTITNEVINDTDVMKENEVTKKIELTKEKRERTKTIQTIETRINDLKTIKIPKLKLITWIGHDSGQFISAPMEILVEKLAGMSWGQSVGSAITYSRRYVRAGALGMSQEDDDNQNIKNNPKTTKILHSPKDIQKVGIKEIEYLNEILKEPERLKKVLDWAKVERVEDISMEAFKMIENKAQKDKAQENEKIQENVDGIQNNFVSEIQANFIKRLVTPERLVAILRDHKITKLDEMTLKDYHALNDTLRLEGSPIGNVEKNKIENKAA